MVILTLYRKLVKCQAVPKAHLVHHLSETLGTLHFRGKPDIGKRNT